MFPGTHSQAQAEQPPTHTHTHEDGHLYTAHARTYKYPPSPPCRPYSELIQKALNTFEKGTTLPNPEEPEKTNRLCAQCAALPAFTAGQM